MVRISSTGEVIDDDNAAARNRRPAQEPRIQQTQHQTDSQMTANPLTGLWQTYNDRIRGFGVQNITVADFVFEPLHVLLAVLLFLFFGPVAFVVGIGLMFFQQYSSRQLNQAPAPSTSEPTYYHSSSSTVQQPSTSAAARPSPRQSPKTATFGGAGQRLGQ